MIIVTMLCDLCELPIRGAPIPTEKEGKILQLCCHGCLRVWELTKGNPDKTGGRRKHKIITQPPAGTERYQAQIEGLWCSSCTYVIEDMLSREPGVYCPSVHTPTGRLMVYLDPAKTDPTKVEAAIQKIGYGIGSPDSAKLARQKDFEELILRFGVAAFLTFNIMMIVEALYVGPVASFLEQYIPALSAFSLALEGPSRIYLSLVLLGLTTPIVFYSGAPILQSGLRRLRYGQMNMDTLIAIGALTAYGLSAVAVYQESLHYYFDTAAMLVTLILLGRLIETFAIRRSSEAVDKLKSLRPPLAHRINNGLEEDILVSELAVGDEIRIRPGEVLPADGVVIDGRSSVSEALVTGESSPVTKSAGDKTIGGTINLDGTLIIQISALEEESVLGQMIRLVEGATMTKAPVVQWADRLSALFVPLVLVISALAVLIGIRMGLTLNEALLRGVATIIIACPCALGMATPITLFQANTQAARHGILIRAADALEDAAKLDILVFDKTGTLTTGQLSLENTLLAESSPLSENETLQLAASLEAASEHPAGRALVKAADFRGLILGDPVNFERLPGLGVVGNVETHRVAVGSSHLIQERNLTIPAPLNQKVSQKQIEGATAVYVVRDDAVIGAFILRDELKPEAAEVIQNISTAGIRPFLLSGDHAATVGALAQQLHGIEWAGDATPQMKIAYLKRFKEAGFRVGMVGDGINDAPALAEADLGIAIGSGSDIALESAGIILMKSDLHDVQTVLKIAQTTTGRIRENLFLAFVYNGLGIPLAAAGLIHPILAAVAMVASSVSVIGNALRSLLPENKSRSAHAVRAFRESEVPSHG